MTIDQQTVPIADDKTDTVALAKSVMTETQFPETRQQLTTGFPKPDASKTVIRRTGFRSGRHLGQ